MINDQYYEGILQLRNSNQNIIDFIKAQVKKEKVAITKVIKEKTGYDYYITSRKFLHKLAKKLQQNYNGQLKISPKLFSKNRLTSKNVYRLNVLFKLFPHKKGDIINHKGEKLKIVNIGNKVLAKNTKGEKFWISYDDLAF